MKHYLLTRQEYRDFIRYYKERNITDNEYKDKTTSERFKRILECARGCISNKKCASMDIAEMHHIRK